MYPAAVNCSATAHHQGRIAISLTGSLPEVSLFGEGQFGEGQFGEGQFGEGRFCEKQLGEEQLAEGLSGRQVLEAFVAKEFMQHYGANVKTFMPWLLGLRAYGELVGVAGLRPAGNGPVFIENYLDRSIEDEVALHAGVPVRRNRILEIGNLAGHYPGVTRSLFPLLTELIYMRGYEWGVCNTTLTVQNALRKLAIPFIPMVQAMPDRLGAARFAWGCYYQHETTVIAISSQAAHDVLLTKPDLAAACSLALVDPIAQLPAADA